MSQTGRMVVAFMLPAAALAATVGVMWLAMGGPDVGLGPHRAVDIAPEVTRVAGGDELEPPATVFERISPLEAEIRNTLIPFSHSPLLAAAPYQNGGGETRASALACLTMAIYYEAAQEPIAGQRAVAQVIINRTASPVFPKTICAVVQQGAPRPGCQFTFMCDGSLGRKPEATQWAAAQAVAEQALDGYVDQEVGAATHYHADYVVPNWATTMFKLVKVGRHIFYRWPGAGALNLAPVIPPVDAGNDGLAAASVNSASSTEVSAAAAQSVKVELPPSPAPVEVAPSSSAPLTQPSAAPAQLPPPPPRPPHRAIPDSSLRVGPLQ